MKERRCPACRCGSRAIVDGSVTTDETGTATARTTVQFDAASQGASTERDVRSVTVNPARAEEGEISGASREILAFPSTWTIDAAATIVDGQVRVSGSLQAVDRDRLEREIAGGKSLWELDPAGAPMAGKTVTATFTEEIPHRVQTGTRYDFIEKKVVPRVRVRDHRTSGRQFVDHDCAGRHVFDLPQGGCCRQSVQRASSHDRS